MPRNRQRHSRIYDRPVSGYAYPGTAVVKGDFLVVSDTDKHYVVPVSGNGDALESQIHKVIGVAMHDVAADSPVRGVDIAMQAEVTAQLAVPGQYSVGEYVTLAVVADAISPNLVARTDDRTLAVGEVIQTTGVNDSDHTAPIGGGDLQDSTEVRIRLFREHGSTTDVDNLPQLSQLEFNDDDYLKVHDAQSDLWCKYSIAQFRQEITDYGLTGGNYNGVIDASVNSNVPVASPPYDNGDWFYVSVAGTIEGLAVDVHDIIKMHDGVWERVPRGSAVAANSRSTLLSTNHNVYADGEAGTHDSQYAGWGYRNSPGAKINWYFFGGANTDSTYGDLSGMYAIMEVKATTSEPYFVAYTKPTGSGDHSWYKSRINWDGTNMMDGLSPGRYVVHTAGMDVTAVEPGTPRIELPYDGTFSAGTQAASEEIWLLSLQTSSNLPEGSNDFVVEQVAYRFGEQTHAYDLEALPSQPAPYTNYFLGVYDDAANYPGAGQLGQWIIDSSDDTILIWDAESGGWKATGITGDANGSVDSPFEYVYSSLDGTGYGYKNAIGNWSNTPDGRLQPVSGNSITSNIIQFATLKNPGDHVTLSGISNNTTPYNRMAFIGTDASVDHNTITWNSRPQVGSGQNYYCDNAEFQTSFVDPYFGRNWSYAGNLDGTGNTGTAPNQEEGEITFAVGDDYKIEFYLNGVLQARTIVAPSSGVDMWIASPASGRIFPTPTGGGQNFTGGTAPSTGGSKYFMSTVGTPGTATEIESGGGYFLYSDTVAGDAGDVELTVQEMADARFCRVFKDFSGLDVKQIADWMQPVVDRDELVLMQVEHLVRGYFHSLDLDPIEIASKLQVYEPALTMRAAGSVELTIAELTLLLANGGLRAEKMLDSLQSLVLNADGTDRVMTRRLGKFDEMRRAFGVRRIEVKADDGIRLWFKTPDLAGAFFAQIQASGGTLVFSNPDAETPGTTYSYDFADASLGSNPRSVQFPTSADVSNFHDLADDIYNYYQSGAQNAYVAAITMVGDETDVVTQCIAELSEHLLKFPR